MIIDFIFLAVFIFFTYTEFKELIVSINGYRISNSPIFRNHAVLGRDLKDSYANRIRSNLFALGFLIGVMVKTSEGLL